MPPKPHQTPPSPLLRRRRLPSCAALMLSSLRSLRRVAAVRSPLRRPPSVPTRTVRQSPTPLLLPRGRIPAFFALCSSSAASPFVIGGGVNLSNTPALSGEEIEPVSFRHTDAYAAIELALDSVVTVSSSPNYFLPWQTKSQRESMGSDSHPMHLYGYQFYTLAMGTCNFDPLRDTDKFNLVDPPERNTVGVPVNRWAVIRFRADNPGEWLLHCHLDVRLAWRLATVLIVKDGVEEMQPLQSSPNDLPKC